MKTLVNRTSIVSIYLFLIVLFFSSISNAQRIYLKNDTLTCMFHKFYVGKELRLGYGSSSDHDFAYVYWGYDVPANGVNAKWANCIINIEEIYTWQNRIFLKCSTKNLANKFNIDIRHAIEFNEIR